MSDEPPDGQRILLAIVLVSAFWYLLHFSLVQFQTRVLAPLFIHNTEVYAIGLSVLKKSKEKVGLIGLKPTMCVKVVFVLLSWSCFSLYIYESSAVAANIATLNVKL